MCFGSFFGFAAAADGVKESFGGAFDPEIGVVEGFGGDGVQLGVQDDFVDGGYW